MVDDYQEPEDLVAFCLSVMFERVKGSHGSKFFLAAQPMVYLGDVSVTEERVVTEGLARMAALWDHEKHGPVENWKVTATVRASAY